MFSVVILSFEFKIYNPIIVSIFDNLFTLFTAVIFVVDESYFCSFYALAALPTNANLIITYHWFRLILSSKNVN